MLKNELIRQLTVASFLTLIGVIMLGTCTPPATVIQTVEVPGPTVVVTATPEPTGTPPPTTLRVCQVGEPESLYLYGGSYAARNVLQAIYDGPIDYHAFDFQPVILEKLPTVTDGDAYFQTVTVQAGERVVDITGEPVTLDQGTQVFPDHTCRDATNPECVVTFDGSTPIEMERMVASWTLKDGVTWSDGEPVTADDSVYSYELACHPDTPSSKYICDRTSSYAAAGGRTVVWTGLPGYVDDLYMLNFFSPLPRHLWEKELQATPADLLHRVESVRQPIGWGPFRITEWVQGSHIALERNPFYFRASEGLPRVDRLVFRFAPNPEGAVAMLMAGECDLALPGDGAEFLLPFLKEAERQGLLRVIAAIANQGEHLEFGINPVATYKRPDFFEDVRVRQAFAHCIDRQAMVDEITLGLGQVADVYIPSGHPLYAGDRLTRWTYDPQMGRALLAEAGWADRDGNGILEAHNVVGIRAGTPFSVTLLTVRGDPQQEVIARMIRANLADCGVHVTVESRPAREFFADGPTGPIYGRQFDLAFFTWKIEPAPPCYLYMTEEIPDSANYWRGSNASGFSSAEYDAACRTARTALPGTFEYRNAHAEAQRIFTEQLPSLPLFWKARLAVARPEVEGFAPGAFDESELWNIEEIRLR
ncbi:MAG: peptide ABC transporter substrate-binding protein [Anaerolineae bacterium]|nr:peptide ABC transporter substrate-binding protein [Anaerolineae bacterium]